MKYITLALLTVAFTSANAFSEPSNKTRFIPLLKSKLGAYEVLSTNSALCVDSELSLLEKNNPSAGFKLGEQIIFGSLHNGTQTVKKPNFCFITSSLKYKSDGLDNGLRMSRCEDTVNEKTIRQSIQFLANNTLKYTLSEPSVECTFKKQSNSK
ncbi:MULTISPECIES: hypothetical protein [Pseudoalteromonas]|jgi:hypothetical protein|uniref:Orphan protein secreted protein n=1 Tax=Pseudoalteromonas aliena SW19 TaxID=1314866 RepID=A0ABR9E5E9_9GAMM|nr:MULTISPECIES: hypothetical protein [Pseudoalteromonas]MBE0361819.1 hypothetical protein [Pseudoalteromonas aliena SW19]